MQHDRISYLVLGRSSPGAAGATARAGAGDAAGSGAAARAGAAGPGGAAAGADAAAAATAGASAIKLRKVRGNYFCQVFLRKEI